MKLIDADTRLSHVRKCDFSELEKMAITFVVCRQPKIDAEPVKHGHWIVADDGVTRCSICYGASDYERSFCGDCGAKMDGGADDDD